jgi:hypothetical protein
VGLVAALLAACSGDNVSTGSGGSTGSATSASASASSTHTATSTVTSTSSGQIPTIMFSGTMVQNGSVGVPGASVCVYQHPDLGCVTTDSKGKFAIGIPMNANTGIQVTKSGLASVLFAIQTAAMDMSGSVLNMPTTTATQSFYASGSTPYPNPGKGYLAVYFQPGNDFSKGAPGAVATLVPAEGTGPLYADSTSASADSTLTATSTSGLVRFGALPPGVVEIDASCASPMVAVLAFMGWQGPDTSKATVPIVDGYETRLSFSCN